MAQKKRLTLDFDQKGYEILSSLSNETGKTLAGVIRSAVALYAGTQAEGKNEHKLALPYQKRKERVEEKKFLKGVVG